MAQRSFSFLCLINANADHRGVYLDPLFALGYGSEGIEEVM